MKYVTVQRITTYEYRVEGNPTDSEAKQIVQRRLDSQMPLDLESEVSEIKFIKISSKKSSPELTETPEDPKEQEKVSTKEPTEETATTRVIRKRGPKPK